jgi:hypothetical protein
VSSKSFLPPKFEVGDLVEYIPGWREAESEIVYKRWIGFVKVVEITTIQTRTAGIYQVNWCDIGRSNGWYTDNQLKLLSRANVNDS